MTDDDADRRRQWLLGVSTVAVLAISIGVGALVASMGPHQEMTRDALPAGGVSGGSGTAGSGTGGSGTGSATVLVAGDLGEIPDRAALVARVGADLLAAAAASPATRGAAPGAAAAPQTKTGSRPCENQARADPGDRGEVVYQASAARAGTPAVVLAFRSSPGSDAITVEMRARSDCRLLLQGAIL